VGTAAVPGESGLEFKRTCRKTIEANQEDEGISRYRTRKDEAAKANSPDTAEDIPGCAANTPQTAHLGPANWDSSAASEAGNITIEYSRKR
jgi:hypothetical protein